MSVPDMSNEGYLDTQWFSKKDFIQDGDNVLDWQLHCRGFALEWIHRYNR